MKILREDDGYVYGFILFGVFFDLRQWYGLACEGFADWYTEYEVYESLKYNPHMKFEKISWVKTFFYDLVEQDGHNG